MQLVTGGWLLGAEVNGEPHFWNLTPDDSEIDLTLHQYGGSPEIGPPERYFRDQLFRDVSILMRYRRYIERMNMAGVVERMVECEF